MRKQVVEIKKGDIFRIKYPFCVDEVQLYDEAGYYKTKTWVPGTRHEVTHGGAEYCEADGIGFMIIEVVSTHKPGQYPERIFFTRKFEDPDGKVFGKKGLRILSVQAFHVLIDGFRYEYEIIA